jgi:glycosyltransferase involved in cell wall biosynthesis
MSRKRVLFVLHNHPSISPGGSETYTMEVYRALQRSGEFEPMVLARADPEALGPSGTRGQAPFAVVGDDPNELLVLVPDGQYDKFFMRMHDKGLFVRHFMDFLRSQRPDVVHFQHTLFLGAEMISAVRRTLPGVPIMFTLHEYLPICNHYGQLVRTSGELCLKESPRRCHECFPEHSQQEFFLRKRLIQSHFGQVDLFIAPSRFLLEQYVEWGIPRPQIRYEEHGAVPVRRLESPPRTRNRFAFFGVLTQFKGVDVLLRAMQRLGPEFDGRLRIHGANYSEQPESMRAELDHLLAATRDTVTYEGPYDHTVLPTLMAEADWVVVPSVWWENSPIVIQEAFLHGRPVICSDVGGMAEKVSHQVNGLLFNVGSPESLAETISAAARDEDLWNRLHEGIPPVRTMTDHVAALESLYRRLIEQRGQQREAGDPNSERAAW